MNIFELFYRNQDSHSGGGWWLHADHEHADPRLVGIRRLRFQKYHPVISPPTNQKGRELIIYPETFSPNIVLKNPCLKAIQVVQTIWAWTACSPCLVLATNLSLLWCFWIVVLEKNPENPSESTEIKSVNPKKKLTLNIHWKDWCWSWSSNNLATWCTESTHYKRPWCWERLRAGGDGSERGWDVWMASVTQWTWVWVNFRRKWRKRMPGVLQFMGSQKVRQGLVIEQQQKHIYTQNSYQYEQNISKHIKKK